MTFAFISNFWPGVAVRICEGSFVWSEALKLTFNGAAAKPLGTAGEVVSRRFTPANFRSYLQTR